MAAALRFLPSLEQPEENEAKTFAELRDTLLDISKTTFRDEQEPLRAVHAKSHGIIRATLTIAAGLPPELAQGLFAKAATYDAVLRVSSAPGDLLPDSVSTHRGVGLKVLGVPGPRLPGGYDDGAQDFLFANGKAFNAASVKKFLANLKLLASTTDKAEVLKVALSAVLRGVEGALEAVGGQSALLTALGGHPPCHPLGEMFFTQVPTRHGDYVAKYGLYPVSEELRALADVELNVTEGFDPVRQAVRNHFAVHGGTWELRAQLNIGPDKMPIEKPDVAWPEDESPYVTVATLEAPAQESWSDANVAAVDRAMAFNPWNGLAAHQPLGAIMRARKVVYPASAAFRLEKAGCPFHHAAE
jgi:hypothetical protein